MEKKLILFTVSYPKKVVGFFCKQTADTWYIFHVPGITSDDGQNFKESKSINLSLTTLGKVIQSLSNNKPGHVPYRESKLTRLLQVNITVTQCGKSLNLPHCVYLYIVNWSD